MHPSREISDGQRRLGGRRQHRRDASLERLRCRRQSKPTLARRCTYWRARTSCQRRWRSRDSAVVKTLAADASDQKTAANGQERLRRETGTCRSLGRTKSARRQEGRRCGRPCKKLMYPRRVLKREAKKEVYSPKNLSMSRRGMASRQHEFVRRLQRDEDSWPTGGINLQAEMKQAVKNGKYRSRTARRPVNRKPTTPRMPRGMQRAACMRNLNCRMHAHG